MDRSIHPNFSVPSRDQMGRVYAKHNLAEGMWETIPEPMNQMDLQGTSDQTQSRWGKERHTSQDVFPSLYEEYPPFTNLEDQNSENLAQIHKFPISTEMDLYNSPPFWVGGPIEEDAMDYHSSASHDPPSRSVTTNQSSLEKDAQKEQEENRLLQLKDELNLSWKDIVKRFEEEFQKEYSVPALRMRYRRLRRRHQKSFDSNEADEAALVAAYEYWDTKRWNIISEKMVEFGATGVWTPKACAAAWARLQGSANKRSRHTYEISNSSEPSTLDS